MLEIYSLKVFGLKVVEVELGKSKTKAYFLVNCLPEASEILDWYFNTCIDVASHLTPRKANYPKMGLLFFILAHIMMNQNRLSESKQQTIEIKLFCDFR